MTNNDDHIVQWLLDSSDDDQEEYIVDSHSENGSEDSDVENLQASEHDSESEVSADENELIQHPAQPENEALPISEPQPHLLRGQGRQRIHPVVPQAEHPFPRDYYVGKDNITKWKMFQSDQNVR
ncbi:hypothetical protein J6590_025460 [Homalodisca vitripennis]|nr:hypothetical protein J6590_025460 [Homalodisca vitripennis]